MPCMAGPSASDTSASLDGSRKKVTACTIAACALLGITAREDPCRVPCMPCNARQVKTSRADVSLFALFFRAILSWAFSPSSSCPQVAALVFSSPDPTKTAVHAHLHHQRSISWRGNPTSCKIHHGQLQLRRQGRRTARLGFVDFGSFALHPPHIPGKLAIHALLSGPTPPLLHRPERTTASILAALHGHAAPLPRCSPFQFSPSSSCPQVAALVFSSPDPTKTPYHAHLHHQRSISWRGQSHQLQNSPRAAAAAPPGPEDRTPWLR